MLSRLIGATVLLCTSAFAAMAHQGVVPHDHPHAHASVSLFDAALLCALVAGIAAGAVFLARCNEKAAKIKTRGRK